MELRIGHLQGNIFEEEQQAALIFMVVDFISS